MSERAGGRSATRTGIRLVLLYGAVFEILLIWCPVQHDWLVALDYGLTIASVLVAILLCFGRPRRPRLLRPACADHGAPRPAMLLAPAMLGLTLLINLTVSLLQALLGSSQTQDWSYSWLVAGCLVGYIPLVIGVLSLPIRPLPGVARTRIAFDSLLIMAAVSTFMWYFVLGPRLLQDDVSLAS